MTFEHLGLSKSILKALQSEGYEHPTPIQEQAIPILLQRKDLLGCAQTGTGKTAAFALPILELLRRDQQSPNATKGPLALVVTPTRELAIQIEESFKTYARHTGIRQAVIYGGVKQGNQVNALKRKPQVLIATPGRLLDLMNQGLISLHQVRHFVLDEADQMLDMGFIHDIKRLLKVLPRKRQSLFFSATMPQAIRELSKSILHNHEKVTIAPEKPTAERINQSLYRVEKVDKPKLLRDILLDHQDGATLVFSRTKHGADKLVKKLHRENIRAAAIHGNKSQPQRQRALNDFKSGKLGVLIATDIAARGIDVDELGLVINYDLPNVPETYVHRIGRTGRASASGKAYSFVATEEHGLLKDIEKLLGKRIDEVNGHPYEGPAIIGSGPGQNKNGQRKSGQKKNSQKKSPSSQNRGRDWNKNRNKNRNRKRSSAKG